METSVPRQRDASDSALVDMLMLEAPIGLALFGTDLRFRWVNAALTRLVGHADGDRLVVAGLVDLAVAEIASVRSNRLPEAADRASA